MSCILHARSCYSLLDSTMTIEQIVKGAKKLGYTTIACTDKNSMHGAMEFFHCCQKEDIKPIFGLELQIEVGELLVPAVVLAKDDEGFKGLVKASSWLSSNQSNLTLMQYRAFSAHWVTLLFGEGGLFESACIHEEENQIIELMLQVKESVPEFYLALSYQESSFWKIRNQLLKKCAKQCEVQTVALNKTYYENKEDAEAYRALCGIRMQKTFHDPSLVTITGRFMLSPFEMEQLYAIEDCENTDKIAALCHVEMAFPKTTLPHFECPNGLTSKEYLTQLCLAGLKKRFLNQAIPEAYRKRLKNELDVILSMNFEDYFLIVWDFIRFARQQKIYVGPGRGSAAGSLVSYCLGITHVDPIFYGLLFERFLNPERISMPDIDIDFPDNRRDEVIAYVKEKYGLEHIGHISTFGTLAAKQVLRDVGRVLDIPLRKVDMLSKAVPFAPKMTLQRAMSESDRFKQIVNADPQTIECFQLALKVEGLPRHVSTHAAGIVMSSLPLTEIVPTIQIDARTVATQYTMEHLEDLGLIKMDFLGLRNLTIIDEIVQQIKAEQPDFDIMRIPMQDKKTFDCIQAVDTVGIFQLESDGMKNLIRKMQPSCFDDIVATIALFRPGPMENIPLFLACKQDPSKVKYLHPDLKPILESTYGVMIYQEQIMQVAQVMAGFSLSKADILRKAMSKKKESELLKLQQDFIQGCLHNKISESLANQAYELILKFANYGFGKAHSVAYALVAYQMAYLKANRPLEFFGALLNSVIGGESKTSEYIDECRRRNVQVYGPSINASTNHYHIENGALRFPLLAIKNVGTSASHEILQERQERGTFMDYYDFVARIMTRRCSRKVIECLIDAGALDEFKVNRRSMRASLDEAISYADLVRIETEGQSKIDLGLVSRPIIISVKEDLMEKANREKDCLGFYLSSHPILTLKQNKQIQVENLAVLRKKMGFIKGFALINRVKQHRTKRGETMAFVSVADESTEFDLVFMPSSYKQYQLILEKGTYLLFEGKKDKEDSCIIRTCGKIEV